MFSIETTTHANESTYVPLTDNEIKEVAMGVFKNEIFGSWMITGAGMLPSVFLVLSFLGEIEQKQMITDGITHIYEYYSKAAGPSINGYPMFMSGRPIDQNDMDKIAAKIKLLQSLAETF